MNPGHNNKRELPLPLDFTDGSFTVDMDTFCVTIDPKSGGWCPQGNYIRRRFKGVMIYSVEVVARSLMTYDHQHSWHDPLVSAMAAQYYSLYYSTDEGNTIRIMEKMFTDKTLHARAKHPCASRGLDCHNPFHRLFVQRRVHFVQLYQRFQTAVERKPELLTDPNAHLVLHMRPETVTQCREQWHEDMLRAAGEL